MMLNLRASHILIISIAIISCKNNNEGAVSCYTATKNNIVQSEDRGENVPVSEVTLEKLNDDFEVRSTEKDEIVLSEKPLKSEKNIVPKEVLEEKIVEEVVAHTVRQSNHDHWNDLLKAAVTAMGNVNYELLKSKRADLDTYLTELNNNQPSAEWSRSEGLAYHINLYNAQTVALILDNFPVKSIKEINGGKPWDKVFIPLDGKKISLNDLEHKIIRPTYKDARVHFALNCAAASCPKLLNEAYTASRLEIQLENQTRAFLNNAAKNDLNPSNPKVSEIFNWYKSDFGDVAVFINRYAKTPITNTRLSYLEYSWDLNQ